MINTAIRLCEAISVVAAGQIKRVAAALLLGSTGYLLHRDRVRAMIVETFCLISKNRGQPYSAKLMSTFRRQCIAYRYCCVKEY
jgi:hypothetical protein